MRSNRYSAFTLIELLVVVAIIAILASILLPVLARARNAARSTECLNNLKQQALTCQLYADDFAGWLPNSDVGAMGWNSLFLNAGYYPATLGTINTIHLVEASRRFRCPNDNFERYKNGTPLVISEDRTKSLYTYLPSRGWNGSADQERDGVTTDGRDGKQIDSFAEPATLIMMTEVAELRMRLHSVKVGNYESYRQSLAGAFGSAMLDPSYRVLLLHGGTFNASFVDGHVASLRWSPAIDHERLWTRKAD